MIGDHCAQRILLGAALGITLVGCSGSGEKATQNAGGASGGIAGTGSSFGGGTALGGATGAGRSSAVGGTVAAKGGAPSAGGSGAAVATGGLGQGGAATGGVDAGYVCTPSGTLCHENGPNPSPLDPPSTPCCDGVCNHATNHCGCSGKGGPCSGLEILYGTDCCPGLECLDTGSARVCDTCRPDGTTCAVASLCCSGICNSITSTCGCSAVGGPCSDSRDCCGPAYCSSAHQCVVDTVCSGNGAACAAASECCSQICNTVSRTCGCGYTGTGCTTNTDCCATASPPLCNSTGKCGCLADGTGCSVAGDCCTGVCNGSSRLCGCSAIGAGCVGAGDCCGGLTCGTAQKCCKASGQSCSGATDCCSGNCKGNGTCS